MVSIKHYKPVRNAICLYLVLASMYCGADVEVIFDNGNTHSLAPFLEPLLRAKQIRRNNIHQKNNHSKHLGAAELKNLLPIRSKGLTPGDVQTKAQKRPFSRPFFLIGSDIRSQRWLTLHRDVLKSINAVGMLVQADTIEEIQAIVELAKGLPFIPASATDIAEALGINHYPVLITPQGIEQ